MGSLTSRPTVPQVRQQPMIITMPSAPVVSAAPASVPVTQGVQTQPENTAVVNEAPTEGTSNEEAQRLAREDNLLRRSRGRLSTVLTGLGGVLSQAASNVARKTLLGE